MVRRKVQQFSWSAVLFLLVIFAALPVIVTAQSSTPEATPEATVEETFRITSSSTTIINPEGAGGMAQEIFYTEIVLDAGGEVPAEWTHFGRVTVAVQSGSICYAVIEAPAETISIVVRGFEYAEMPASTDGAECVQPSGPCDTLCVVPIGSTVLLRAGDSITHVIPEILGPTDPPGLLHSYINLSDGPTSVVIIEHGPPMVMRSCHGGCP